MELWKKSALGFIERMEKDYPDVEIVLVKNYLAEHEIDQMDPNDVLGRGGEKDLLVLEQEAVIRYVEETICAMNGENKAF